MYLIEDNIYFNFPNFTFYIGWVNKSRTHQVSSIIKAGLTS